MEEISQTSAPSGGSYTKWLIIGGVIVVLVIGAYLVRGMFWMAPIMSGADVDRNMDGSVTYTTDEGSVTVGGGGSMPENWPSDAPEAYSGANIIYSGTSNPTTGESGSAVSYTVNAPVESVVEYYRAQLEAHGWTILSTADAGGMRVIAAEKDGRTIGIYVGSNEAGVTAVTAGIQI